LTTKQELLYSAQRRCERCTGNRTYVIVLLTEKKPNLYPNMTIYFWFAAMGSRTAVVTTAHQCVSAQQVMICAAYFITG